MYLFNRVLLCSKKSSVSLWPRCIYNSTPIITGKYGNEQLEYLNTVVTCDKIVEWSSLKRDILKIPGSINEKNIDAILLKTMAKSKKFANALSFAEFLKKTNKELSLGLINGLLILYFEIGRERKLSSEQEAFILVVYKDLYSKYKVLDATTAERLLHALCVIHNWKGAMRVLEDIYLSSKPTHSAYSTLIETLFNINKKAEAFRMIERSIQDNRPLKTKAYSAWINYILRKYKENKTKLKYLEDICVHIFNNSSVVDEECATKVVDVYNSLGWQAHFTRVRKVDGQCLDCGQRLNCLKLNHEEFLSLQTNVKDKLIVGSDLFLKTLPEELERFLKFFKETAPYDIVLDALNIAYVARNGTIQRVDLLKTVVNHFASRNKKILLLGRKYMLHWPRKQMAEILSKTSNFFIDDLSQDDPYFITAAILSGSHTDLVSKDLLRGHKFLLKDEKLRLIFNRWQWQHQWMVFINRSSKLIIQPPLAFTPCAQKINGSWHLPFEKQNEDNKVAQVNDGTPNLANWICLQPSDVTR